MAAEFHLKQFDGPLDLLLHLIGKAKIEPKDIFVSEITEQYIEIVRSAPDFDMDETSDFIQMAALLVEIKSRRLLPKPPKENAEEEDPEAVLVRRLEQYRQFRESARSLAELEAAARDVFGKLPEENVTAEPQIELEGLSLKALWDALSAIAAREPRAAREEPAPARAIRRDVFTVEGCMETIQSRLRFGETPFEALFSDYPTREEAVTLFMALLETLKQGAAHVRQDGPFGAMTLVPGPAPIIADTEEETDGTDETASGD